MSALARAVAEAGDALALLDDEGALSYRALRTALPSATPLVLRASPTRATLLALHAALHDERPIAPLHPQATVADEARLADRLAIRPPRGVCISTSGSTGEPKLVELGWGALAAHAQAASAHLGLRGDDRWLVSLPLSHTGGLSIAVRCLAARAAVVLASAPPLGPSFAPWLADTVATRGITRLSLVPAQLGRLLDDGIAPPPGLRSLLLGGQAATPRLVTRALDAGWPLVTSYGLTETCGLCVASAIGERLPDGVAGRPLPGVELRLRDGLLELRTAAQASRVDGSQSFTEDGWLRTRDRATLDGGLVTILGRADDLIISAGHKIDPLEVEAALCALPTVAAAAVLGRPDPRFGATLVAFVVAARGPAHEIDRAGLEAALAAGLADRLPPYKRPRELLLVEELPLSKNGKLDRAALARLL